MIKATIILDNKYACDLSPVEFVKKIWLSKVGREDLVDIICEQEGEFEPLSEGKNNGKV